MEACSRSFRSTTVHAFPRVDAVGQVKVVTLEIVKIYIVQTEYRVAHLMLSNLCKRFPDDPYLWNYLGKLYLDIGKREDAVAAFKTAEDALAKVPNVSKEAAETNKLFNQYLLCQQVEAFSVCSTGSMRTQSSALAADLNCFLTASRGITT